MAPPPIAPGQDLPSQPLYSEQQSPQDDYWAEDGVRELHAVTSADLCNRMAERFKREGRKVELVDIQRNPNPGAMLPFLCIFEGEDAKAGYYNDRRYNSADEYQ
jgi:hypothetical protein